MSVHDIQCVSCKRVRALPLIAAFNWNLLPAPVLHFYFSVRTTVMHGCLASLLWIYSNWMFRWASNLDSASLIRYIPSCFTSQFLTPAISRINSFLKKIPKFMSACFADLCLVRRAQRGEEVLILHLLHFFLIHLRIACQGLSQLPVTSQVLLCYDLSVLNSPSWVLQVSRMDLHKVQMNFEPLPFKPDWLCWIFLRPNW